MFSVISEKCALVLDVIRFYPVCVCVKRHALDKHGSTGEEHTHTFFGMFFGHSMFSLLSEKRATVSDAIRFYLACVRTKRNTRQTWKRSVNGMLLPQILFALVQLDSPKENRYAQEMRILFVLT